MIFWASLEMVLDHECEPNETLQESNLRTSIFTYMGWAVPTAYLIAEDHEPV